MITLKELSEKILKEKKAALFCHCHPDGDTIGSACALKLALKEKGVSADVFCSDPIPEKYFFLEEPKSIITEFNGDFNDYSALIAIDNAELSRLGKFAEKFAAHKNTYNIDHHISNGKYADVNYVLDRASNSENVFALIKETGVIITKDIADLLTMGIMLDTGGFRHKNVTDGTFSDTSELIKFGADVNKIYYNTFSKQSKQRAKLFGRTMANLRFFYGDRIAVATVRLKDIKECEAKQEETEGFIDFVMGIDTVEVGACVMETETDKFKISLRSKGPDVNAIAGTFGGGGHKLASGCKIFGEYEEVVDKLTFAISRYLED